MKQFPLSNIILCSLLGVVGILASSCQEEQKDLGPSYNAGVLIYNTGTTSGTISYYDRATGTITEPDLFNKINARGLEGNVSSWTSAFEKTYLITGSPTIEVLQSNSFASAGTITGLEQPQNLVAYNSRTGFISDWAVPSDSDRVMVVNLLTNQVVDTIKTGVKPGAMVLAGTRLFVANSSGNKVNVINVTTSRIEATITVGDNPNSMVVDASGYLWVLSSGKADASDPASATKGQLTRITPNNLTTPPVVFTFPSTNFQPHHLSLSASRNRLYFIYDGVYVMDTKAIALPAAALIPRSFQAVAQDPTDGLLYAAKAPENSGAGWVIRYRNSGAAVDSFQVEGSPTGFSFR